MNAPRTLTLVAIAMAVGFVEFDAALEFVEKLSPTLSDDDIEAGRAVAAAATARIYRDS